MSGLHTMKKMKTTATNPTIFSNDITVEIFSRLPVKSLLRFKCVSRFFNSLVSESYLMDIHRRRSRSTSRNEIKFFVPVSKGFYSMEMKEDGEVSTCNFDFLYDHLSYANGLFYFWVEQTEPVRIFNPGTREVRLLPRVKQLYPLRCLREFYLSSFYGCFYFLGYEPQEKKYKILMTLCVSRECTKNWVFTLGSKEYWREVKSTVDFFPHKRGICICGVIYFFVHSKRFIVAFDVKAENFKTIKLWNASHDDYELIEVKGKLAVQRCFSNNVNLWILENTQKEEWHSHIVSFSSQVGFDAYEICSFCNGEILIFVSKLSASTNDRLCYCYDVRNNSGKYVKILWPTVNDWIDEGIYTYVESLIPLKKICSARHQS
ncbi:putative F-box protein At1g32420 [Lycium ferocissimum]|uniref:putative F-box protein At1g32420 n=1 Tax=Lycium ferocissimum TaxID=112874 RepID=UPI002814FB5C|nr:putative F-box protein At1g32420 [Lycium ferocissimum]